jgi:hypothetical protein
MFSGGATVEENGESFEALNPHPLWKCAVLQLISLQVHDKRVSRHLCEKHQIPKASRRGVDRIVASLELCDPRSVNPRPNRSIPHPLLQVSPGFVCRRCGNLTISSKLHQQHRCASGQLVNIEDDSSYDDLDEEVSLQSWVKEGRRPYWIVKPEDPSNESSPSDVFHQPSDQSSRLEQLCQAERTRLEEQRETARDDKLPDLTATSPWFRRTRWLETYCGADRSILVRLASLPTVDSVRTGRYLGTHDGFRLQVSASDERRIVVVLRAIEELYSRCEETVHHTARPILCRMYSLSLHSSTQRAFQLVHRPASRSKYIRVIKKYFSFLLSIYLLNPATCLSALSFQLSGAQRRAIGRLLDDPLWTSPNAEDMDPLSAIALVDNDDDDEEMADEEEDEQCVGEEEAEEEEEEEIEGGSDSDEDATSMALNASHDERSMRNREPSAVDKLAELVLELSAFFAMEEFSDGQPASSLLVYFSGILGMSRDGTYQKIRNFTPNLAALIYYLRFVFLEWTLPYRDYPYIGRNRRPALNPLAILQPVREKYICFGCLTALPEFVSLLAFGHKVAHTDGPTIQFHWSDDGQQISYGDHTLGMEQFRSFSHSLIERCGQLCRTLMYGWEPPVQLDRIRDDMSNTQRGYSFIHHPANRLSEAHLDLFRRACTAPENALMRQDHWVPTAVRRYADGVSELRRIFSCLFLLTGGGEPRVTELSGLECINTASSRRGIYIYNGRVIFYSPHHKSRHVIDRDFQVARALPEAVETPFFYYFVYIRRLSDMIRRECKLGGSQTDTLFYTGTRKMTATDLTQSMREYSQAHIGQPLHCRLYRQLAIAVMERHVPRLLQPFDIHDDTNPHRMMHSVRAWQSGHRPRQRAAYYGHDGALPTSLTPALLEAYIWSSTQWHRFLRLHRDRSPPPTEEDMALSLKRKRVLSENPNLAACHLPSVSPSPAKRPKLSVALVGSKSPIRTSDKTVSARGHTAQPAFNSSNTSQPPVSIIDLRTSNAVTSSALTIKAINSGYQLFLEGSASPFLYFHLEHSAMICIPCGRRVGTGKSFETHIRHVHRLKGKEFIDAVTFSQQLIAADEIAPLANDSPIIPYLRLFHGFGCLGCGYLTSSPVSRRLHCNKCPIAQDLNLKWFRADIQSWSTGSYADYWIVEK